MKRLLIPLALAAALALCAAGAWAFALETEYRGTVNDEGSFGFDLKKRNGTKRVKNVIAGMTFTCEEGDPGQNGIELDGSFRVHHDGTFGGKTSATVVGLDPPAKLTGKLKPHHKAVGTLRAHGELDPLAQPGLKCDTDTQDWKAKRDAN